MLTEARARAAGSELTPDLVEVIQAAALRPLDVRERVAKHIVWNIDPPLSDGALHELCERLFGDDVWEVEC